MPGTWTMDLRSLPSVVRAFAAKAIACWILKVTLASLKITKHAVERAGSDWAKQKWFDLHCKTGQAYNPLAAYPALYPGCHPASRGPEQEKDRDRRMAMFREVCTRAAVFPQNQAIGALFGGVQFSRVNAALSKERPKVLADASEQLRQKAVLHTDVLKDEKRE
jgi:hypothetical protein